VPRTDGNRIDSHTLARKNFADAHHSLIAEAAYEKRDFGAPEVWQNWFAAQCEIDGLVDPDL
jgi:hypothetical protein